MDEFKVGDIVKTIRQSYGVNFSEAVVIGRHNEYICVIAKTRHGYNNWWVDPKDIIKTKQELLDDRDLELDMSMFWIEFDPSVTEQDIIDFQRNHVNEYNMFCSCGRFVQRIIATGRSDKIMRSYEYMAANVEAANIDLKAWTT